jgi:undecaprenyl-diphosphatase
MVTVIAGVMAFREKWWLRVWWVLFVLIVAYQRMYTGVHFPLDVLAGFMIGVVSSLLTLLVMQRKILAATPATSALQETASLS